MNRLAVMIVLFVAGCSNTAAPATSATPSGSAATPALPSPNAEPTPSMEPSEPSEPPVDSVPIPSNAYARVVTNDLRVRSKPGVSGESMKLDPLLQRGVLLVVLDGPVQASGYDWYQVQPTISLDDAIEYPAGWVAAADKDGKAWIEPDAVACPPEPTDVGTLGDLGGNEMYWEITCLSGVEFTLPARLVSPSEWCGLGEWATVDPAWMGECTAPSNYLVAPDDVDGERPLHPRWSPDVDLSIAPAVEAPSDAWPPVEVTGMFDHPAAATCDPAAMIIDCRLQFVVTSMHVVDR
jgi:hypothetical protein